MLLDSDYEVGMIINFPDPSTAVPTAVDEVDQDEGEESEDETDDEEDD